MAQELSEESPVKGCAAPIKTHSGDRVFEAGDFSFYRPWTRPRWAVVDVCSWPGAALGIGAEWRVVLKR
ncbi:MAG: hypothetical protein AAFQ95_15840 [Cyanobacteria bacterium J06621_3]